jgi:hypothetical protein
MQKDTRPSQNCSGGPANTVCSYMLFVDLSLQLGYLVGLRLSRRQTIKQSNQLKPTEPSAHYALGSVGLASA